MLLPAIPILQIGSDTRLLRVCSDLIREVSGASAEISALETNPSFDLTPYPVILLQLDSCGADRLATLKQIRARAPLSRVLGLTASPVLKEAVVFMRQGGEDYLELPLDAELLKAALIEAIGRADERSGRTALSLAYIDEHTGLPNARHLAVTLDGMLAGASPVGAESAAAERFAVLFVDIDDFKNINDEFGHRAGNEVLSALGRFLRQQLRDRDLLFRYAGDEFVVLISGLDAAAHAQVAERLRVAVSTHVFDIAGADGLRIAIELEVSIGVAVYPDHATSKEDILEAADRALYGRKRVIKQTVKQPGSSLPVQLT
jgi:two-component system cell cycle response regulator